MWPNIQILGALNNFWTNWAICFRFGTEMEDGALLRMDHKTTLKLAWPWSCDPISKFWDPYNFWMNKAAIRFKFGTDIEDGPLLRMDHKTTPKWTWPGSHDPISKFWDPYNFWTNRAIGFKYDPSFIRTIKWVVWTVGGYLGGGLLSILSTLWYQ